MQQKFEFVAHQYCNMYVNNYYSQFLRNLSHIQSRDTESHNYNKMWSHATLPFKVDWDMQETKQENHKCEFMHDKLH